MARRTERSASQPSSEDRTSRMVRQAKEGGVMDRLIELLREELQTALKGPGVTWNLVGILSQFDRACCRAIAMYAKENNIPID